MYRAESIARRILEKQDIGKPRVDVCTNDDMENESVESHSKIDDIITEKAMSIKNRITYTDGRGYFSVSCI